MLPNVNNNKKEWGNLVFHHHFPSITIIFHRAERKLLCCAIEQKWNGTFFSEWFNLELFSSDCWSSGFLLRCFQLWCLKTFTNYISICADLQRLLPNRNSRIKLIYRDYFVKIVTAVGLTLKWRHNERNKDCEHSVFVPEGDYAPTVTKRSIWIFARRLSL